MEELSLEDLQAALVSVQETKATTRLSERNIVELVSKLQQTGLLDNGLLHSIQGKEYITPKQLRKEIRQAVHEAGGRLAVADLPAQLSVDMVHCEKQAQSFVEECNGQVQIIQGELMTTEYFDGVAAEVEELLQDSGIVAIGDMARRFRLGSELMQSIIVARLESVIGGRMESGILFTSMYITRVKSQLRGALRGASRPVNLTALSKSLDLESTINSGKTVQSIVAELILEGAVVGISKAGTNTFVPRIFAMAQQQAVQDFYDQNGFIETDMLERLGVTDPAGYMASNAADSLALEEVFVSPRLVSQLEAAVEEAVVAGSWTDALANLPTAIGPKDAASLLSKAVPRHVQGKVLAGTCVISLKLLEELKEHSLAVAREAAEAAIQSRRASSLAASTSASGKQTAPVSAPQKGEVTRQGGTLAAVVEDDDSEDWDTGKAGSRKKKGGKRRPIAKQKNQRPVDSNSKAKQGLNPEASSIECLSLNALAAKVEEWIPDAEGAGEDGGFAEAVAADIRPAAALEFDKAQAAIFLAGAETRRRKREELAMVIDEASARFQLYNNGIDFAKGDEGLHTALQRHLLRTAGQRIADLLLRSQEIEMREEDESADRESRDHLLPLPASARSQLLSLVSSDIASTAMATEKALNSADTLVAWEALQEEAKTAGLPLQKLDKKAEKALLQEHKAALRERLSSQDEPAEALSLVVPLLVVQVCSKAMSIPGKALAGVINILEDELPQPSFAQLSKFHKLVVEDLRTQSQQGSKELAAMLPGIRNLADLDSTSNMPTETSCDLKT